MKSRVLIVMLLLSVVGGCREQGLSEKRQEPLRPPSGFGLPVAGGAEQATTGRSACDPAPEPPTGDLDYNSKYEGSDSARDDLNPDAARRYRKQTAEIRKMEKDINKMVERYLSTGQVEDLNCSLHWLTAWAEAEALTGEGKTHTGKAVRKWSLGSMAASYARLKFSASAPLAMRSSETELIEEWMHDLAWLVVADWSDQPLDKINNHEYWAAWSIMVVAVIENDHDLFGWAVETYRIAAEQIDAQGYLPNELARDTRALFYHNYALPPLAMIAAFGQANGLDLIAEGDFALRRLAENVMRGINDPTRFANRTGTTQNQEGLDDGSKFTWMEPYCWLQPCDDSMRAALLAQRPLHNYRVGGDVTTLFRATPPRAARLSGQSPQARSARPLGPARSEAALHFNPAGR